MAKRLMSTGFEAEDFERADRLAERFSAERGERVPRSEVVRRAFRIGCDVLEHEFDEPEGVNADAFKQADDQPGA